MQVNEVFQCQTLGIEDYLKDPCQLALYMALLASGTFFTGQDVSLDSESLRRMRSRVPVCQDIEKDAVGPVLVRYWLAAARSIIRTKALFTASPIVWQVQILCCKLLDDLGYDRAYSQDAADLATSVCSAGLHYGRLSSYHSGQKDQQQSCASQEAPEISPELELSFNRVEAAMLDICFWPFVLTGRSLLPEVQMQHPIEEKLVDLLSPLRRDVYMDGMDRPAHEHFRILTWGQSPNST